MAWWRQAASALLVLACLCISEGARKINVQEQMQRARRSRSVDEISRGRREDIMGLGKAEGLQAGRAMKTVKGTTKVKFQETYEGLPIAGASVVFEEDDNGNLMSEVSGNLVAGVEDDIPDLKPRLSVTEAFDTTVMKNHDNPNSVTFDPKKDATLEVYLDDTLGETADARLVYKLSYRIEKEGRLSRPFALVDANTGDIISQWEGLSLQRISKRGSGSNRVHSNYDFQTVGGNKKMGKANYDGKAYPKLEITKNDDGSCSLGNNVARVYHCNNSWSCYDLDPNKPFTFDCDKGLSDSVNGAYSPLADALFYISATYEMFDSWYDVKDPLKKSSSESSVCGARIHFGSSFENAFWDGYFITFGDGNNTFYPLTSINVVAHEIAHGVTEMNSGLIYQGESGGINEAFSDMAGEAVEFYANSKPDWMIGYEIFKKPDKALRYFDDPSKDGSSIGHYKKYCPGIDVHHSSGVFNRAFYHLGRTTGWDVKKAFRPFVVANILYWMPSSRFYQAACGVVRAANDLGYNGTEVTEAFRKVGIEPCEDTSTGIITTTEINVPAGHEILIQVEIAEDMDIEQMTIVTRGGRMSMAVETPTCKQCSRKTHYEGKLEICDVKEGLYNISLIPVEDLVKGSVLITGGSTNVFSNGTLKSSNETIDFEFQMPKEIIKRGGQVMVEMTTEYGYALAAIRHGEKPDVTAYIADFVVTLGRPTIVCDLKPGTYYGHILSWHSQVRGIDINVIGTLTGKRLDSPPVVTRVPPPSTLPTTTPTVSPTVSTTVSTTVSPTVSTTVSPTVSPTEAGSASGSGAWDTEAGEDDEGYF